MLVHAYAKINLGLHIIRKREDGYHDIQTIFHRINVSDEITFTKKDSGISLQTNLSYIPTDKRNLCVRAAQMIFDEIKYTGGIHIHLEKKIPVGAGLGGGSSDAAAILLHLPAFIDHHIAKERLRTFAESLGSDVPFFLETKSAYATGRGEILEYFDLEFPYLIVVVYPQVHVSTSWAYSKIKIDPQLPRFNLRDFILTNIRQPNQFVNKLRNDFEPVIFSHHETVMCTKEILYHTGAEFALMSGSGSGVFGLFTDEGNAKEAAEFFSKKYSVFITQPDWKP